MSVLQGVKAMSDSMDARLSTKPDAATPSTWRPTPAESIEFAVRGEFADWLAASGGSLAVTTYNSGKLAILSVDGGGLTVTTWKFARPMGMAVEGEFLAVAVREQILIFARSSGDASARLSLEQTNATGKLDIHDMAYDRRGLTFVATRFNCLARPSERANFKRVWSPPFLSKMVPRDCCHLNGLGLREGVPGLVTAFCEGVTPGAWRGPERLRTGVAMELPSGDVVMRGLSMPHSPRWQSGRWWLCNSGEGSLAILDETAGKCEEVIGVPGFTRGLVFVGGMAVVGRSRVRKRHILDAPPVRQRFGILRAGVSVVDVVAGREIGAVDFLKGGREVYDVAFLPTRRVEFVGPSYEKGPSPC